MRGRSERNKEPKTTTNLIDIEKEPPVKKRRTTINVEDTATFCNEFSKALEYMYFGDTCDENDEIKICNINFFI